MINKEKTLNFFLFTKLINSEKLNYILKKTLSENSLKILIIYWFYRFECQTNPNIIKYNKIDFQKFKRKFWWMGFWKIEFKLFNYR